MTWDVTVTDTLAESYLSTTSVIAGAAAEGAASHKEAKYQALTTTHSFIPIAFETLGPINAKGLSFFNKLGRRLSTRNNNNNKTRYTVKTRQDTVKMPSTRRHSSQPGYVAMENAAQHRMSSWFGLWSQRCSRCGTRSASTPTSPC